MANAGNNPLFTRSEKKRVRKKIVHKVKGAARKGFARLFGIPLSPGLGGKPATRRRARPSGSPSSSSVRGDVLSALGNLGYKKPVAERMVPQPASGEGFDSLFRRAVAKNPGELIIFGNPEKVYSRATLAKHSKNPLPLALLPSVVEGAGFAAGSKLLDTATRRRRANKREYVVIMGHRVLKGSKKHEQLLQDKRRYEDLATSETGRGRSNPPGKRLRRSNAAKAENYGVGQGFNFHGAFKDKAAAQTKEKAVGGFIKSVRMGRGDYRYVVMTPRKNPDAIGQAKDLFSQFHKRGAEGVFDLQINAKRRKDYTILGPLVALGINAEKYDTINPREDDVVQHWEKLPHMAFLTSSQVEHAKRVLDDPHQYLKEIALLASSPNGKQLYVVSSEPLEINVSQFETDAQKDFVDLGEATFVVYIAKKPHEVLEWVHVFAEEGGTRPRLGYARLGKEIFFLGGSYRVEAPGIIN